MVAMPGLRGLYCQACCSVSETRLCLGCKTEHPIGDFRRARGLARMRCKACAEAQAEAYGRPLCVSCDERHPRDEFYVRGQKTVTCSVCREIRDREIAVEPYQSTLVEHPIGSEGWRRLEDEAREKNEAALRQLRKNRDEVLGR